MPAAAMKVAPFLVPAQPIFANHTALISCSSASIACPSPLCARNGLGTNRTLRQARGVARRFVPHCKGPAHQSPGELVYRETLVFLLRRSSVDVTRTTVNRVRRSPVLSLSV